MHTNVAIRWLAIAMVVLLSGAGCKKRVVESTEPERKAVSAPENPADWPLYEVASEGFALALPPDWTPLEANPQTFDDQVKKLLVKKPGLRAMTDLQRQQVKAGIRFFGFDKESMATGRGASVNVGRFALPVGGTLASVTEQNIGQMSKAVKLVGTMKRERKTTPYAQGERIQYQIEMVGPNGRPLHRVITQYLFVSDAHYFVVTFVWPPDQFEKAAENATAMCESFRLLKK